MKSVKGMKDAIVVPTVLYESGTWMMNVRNVRRVEAVEIRNLRSICSYKLC